MNMSVFALYFTECAIPCVCDEQAKSSLPPRLPTQHTHAGHVDAYEPPRHQVLKGSQRPYKSVWVGAVGVPVSRIDSQTARAARSGAVTRRLEEVLLLVDIVDVYVRQHRHLVAWDVCGCGLVAHPDADALTHWVNSTVLRLPSSPVPASAGALWPCRLCIGGLSAEEHPGWEVAAFGEEFGVHCGDGAGVTAWTLLLCCSSDGRHSLGTEEEEQDQHGRPHGHHDLRGVHQHRKSCVTAVTQSIIESGNLSTTVFRTERFKSTICKKSRYLSVITNLPNWCFGIVGRGKPLFRHQSGKRLENTFLWFPTCYLKVYPNISLNLNWEPLNDILYGNFK